MKLKELIKDVPFQSIIGSLEITILGLAIHSKLVSPGFLFLAKKGTKEDGGKYVAEAISRGAVAIVTETYNPLWNDIVQLIHPNPQAIEALLAAQFYGFPDEELWMIGMTGTKGKTTTTRMIKHFLDDFYGPCGLLGTIDYIIGNRRLPAKLTTPDLFSTYQMLREMVEGGCRSAVMEVSSHALTQGRVEGIDYDIAVFSNLTLDHLDYHGTMEEYCEAKSLLFSKLGKNRRKKTSPKKAIVNGDSPWTKKIVKNCQEALLTYGFNQNVDLRAFDGELKPEGTLFKVAYEEQIEEVFLPLIGRFNVYNALGAIAVALTRGMSLKEIKERLKTVPPVPGRLQPIQNDLGINIFIDFAHTDDALINVLETLQELKKGRIITVFGCGGDRDRTKRPKMAQAAESLSDFCIVTSDNPRSESPEAICNEIVVGFQRKESYTIEIDRRTAIKKAIETAKEHDIVLIAGKGHETYQIFANQTIHFDDCQVASEICSQFLPLNPGNS